MSALAVGALLLAIALLPLLCLVLALWPPRLRGCIRKD
jgi:hypothetical protein